MAKAKKFVIRCFGRSIEMSKANSSTLIYRIPYQNLNSKDELFSIDNPFIVYILFGKNESGKDVIYVGKSKNGLKRKESAKSNLLIAFSICRYSVITKQREDISVRRDMVVLFLI